jgi:hypothetical protein
MVKNTLIYLSLVLLLVGVLGVGIYQNEKQDIKYCDSITLKQDYNSINICYEPPKTGLKVTGIKLTNILKE